MAGHLQKHVAAIALMAAVLAPRVCAAQEDMSPDVLRDELKARDAAIIRLQSTVRDLQARLERVERAIGPEEMAGAVADGPASQDLAENDDAPPAGNRGVRLAADEEAAERALERTLVQGGALLLPAGVLDVAPSFTYAHSQTDYPVLSASGGMLSVGSNAVRRSSNTVNVSMRLGLPLGAQLELAVPYYWSKESVTTRIQGASSGLTAHSSSSGFGGFQLGLAKTLLRERAWRPDIVGRISWNNGKGRKTETGVVLSGYDAFTGSLTFIKRSDPLVFVGSASYRTFSTANGVKPGDQFGFTLGTSLAVSPTTSLSASVSNQFLNEVTIEGEELAGSTLKAMTLNLGAGTLIHRGIFLNLSTSMGITDDAPDYSIGLSSSFRFYGLRSLVAK